MKMSVWTRDCFSLLRANSRVTGRTVRISFSLSRWAVCLESIEGGPSNYPRDS